jgi:hypothetical protein
VEVYSTLRACRKCGLYAVGRLFLGGGGTADTAGYALSDVGCVTPAPR